MTERTEYQEIASQTSIEVSRNENDEARKKTELAALNAGIVTGIVGQAAGCCLGAGGIAGLVVYPNGDCPTITFAICVPVCCFTSVVCGVGSLIFMGVRKYYKKNN